MLSDTIQLLNNFLDKAHFQKDNYFNEEDFNTNINHDIGIIYPNEEFSLAQKCILVHHEGLSFHIYLLCVVEKSKDQLYALSFGCKEINNDQKMIMVEYIHMLIIQFSSLISEQLYDGLKDYSRLDKIYLSTYIRLSQKINETNTKDKQFIIDDYQLNHEFCHLDSQLYLTIFLHENGLLNYLLIFAEKDYA